MQLGGYDTQYFKNPSATINYIPLDSNGSYYWNVDIQAVRVGKGDFLADGVTPSSWSFTDGLPTAQMSTTCPEIFVPDTFYTPLITALTTNTNFQSLNNGGTYMIA